MQPHSLIAVTSQFAVVVTALLAGGDSAAQTAPDPWRASVAIASDNVHSGLLQTHDNPSLRLAVDYQHDNGFFAGGTLANVDYVAEARFETQRDTQASAYSGYLWRRGHWRTNVTVTQYLYADFERDYDYTQTLVGASYRDRYFISLGYSSDYLDLYDRSKQASAGIALPWVHDLEFSLSAGRVSFGGRFAASFSHWNIGLSRAFGRFAADLRFHDSTLDRDSIAGNLTHDQWVVSMTYSLLPLRRSRDRR